MVKFKKLKDYFNNIIVRAEQNKLLCFVYVLGMLFLINACATVEKPNGGPADRTPPQVFSATPADSSIHTNNKLIILEFNEFIKLNNPNSQIIINPFPKEKPEFSVQGKKVKIELKDSLLPNTTYHIFFGNAIQDITENNPAAGLDYVFSTGSYLDSCTLSGFAGDAFTNKFTDKAWVMLYKSLHDFRDTLPVYIAHVDAKGAFKFRNISAGSYYLCALEDNNSNFRFDIPDEKIAFSNNLYLLTAEKPTIDSVNLYLFTEKANTQKHLKTEMIHYHTVRSSFRMSFEHPQITILNKKGETTFEWNEKKDTVIFYIKGPDADSLRYIIRDGAFSDTLYQALKYKGRQKDFSTDTLFRISSTKGEKITPNESISISSIIPIEHWDFSKTLLAINKDTLPVSMEKSDETGRQWTLLNKLKPGENAVLIIKKGAATNIFGYKNDSIKLTFRMIQESDLGSLQIDLMNLPGKPLIVSASSKEKTYTLISSAEKEQIVFKNMLPGEYNLKIIIDENEDGEWTPGIFDQKKQAEKVFTLPRPVQIKKNWESKIGWNLTY
ncbi:MAG: Ig-like domain-containing protein [Bacteroidales bacterium]